jgi:restriction endonuclease Mrr
MLISILSYIIDNFGSILICASVIFSIFVTINLVVDNFKVNKYKEKNYNDNVENNLIPDDNESFISSIRSNVVHALSNSILDDTKSDLISDKLEFIKERLIVMDGRDFEEFCVILFKKTGEYESVDITPYKYDGGKDIILTTKLNSEKIYVECKRLTPRATTNEEIMVGRPVCQKLIGAMDGEGISKGVIITTGNVHYNAREYIKKLELNNADKKLTIIELDEILEMCNNLSSIELSTIFNTDDSNPILL